MRREKKRREGLRRIKNKDGKRRNRGRRCSKSWN
jgi:hypothetical protein